MVPAISVFNQVSFNIKGLFGFKEILTQKWHNFVLQFVTWRVVTSEERSVMGHVGTHLYQLQLATWRVVAQSCVIFGSPSNFLV